MRRRQSASSLCQTGGAGALAALSIVLGSGVAWGCAPRAQQPEIRTADQALDCAREAIGGSRVLSNVSSLAVTFDVTPDPANSRGVPSTIELVFGYPDKFRLTTIHRIKSRASNALRIVSGFAGDHQFITGDDETQFQKPNQNSLRVLHDDFARWTLLLLLRSTTVKPLTWAEQLEFAGSDVRIAAASGNDFEAGFLINRSSCQPVAMTWERPSNVGDAMSGRETSSGRHVERRDLLDYGMFDGVRLPTRIRVSTDGIARSEMTLTAAKVNGPLTSELLTPAGN